MRVPFRSLFVRTSVPEYLMLVWVVGSYLVCAFTGDRSTSPDRFVEAMSLCADFAHILLLFLIVVSFSQTVSVVKLIGIAEKLAAIDLLMIERNGTTEQTNDLLLSIKSALFRDENYKAMVGCKCEYMHRRLVSNTKACLALVSFSAVLCFVGGGGWVSTLHIALLLWLRMSVYRVSRDGVEIAELLRVRMAMFARGDDGKHLVS